MIAAIVFLGGIGGWVGYEYHADYQAKVGPLQEVMIDVNGVKFNMQYFISAIDAYAGIYGWNSSVVSNYGNDVADLVADNIINGESLRQGAQSMNITVSSTEINTGLQQYGWPNTVVFQDIMRTTLLDQKVKDYFGSQVPDLMEQAHVQVVLVESEAIANGVITQVDAGGNFTALANEFSCNSSIEGDLGWLPFELMPNAVIASAAVNGAVEAVSQPIYDETAVKDVGYWLIEIKDKQGNQINAEAMLLGSQTQADQVKAELAGGADFGSLAAQYSQYQGGNSTGELGWKKMGDMGSTAFDQVAFDLPLNQVSDPVRDTSVQTTGGYWLVNVVDRGDLALSDNLKQQLIDGRYNRWLGNWMSESTISTYLDPDKKQYAINQVLSGM